MNRSTWKRPFEIVTGMNPRGVSDLRNVVVGKRTRHHDFEVGDEVMVHLKKERFQARTYSKLRMRKFCPCKILRKFNSRNAYEVELPNDIDIPPIFNVFDFYKYHKSNDEGVVSYDYPKK